MFYENIIDGDDKDNPGSNYELENILEGCPDYGMKYEGETGKPLKQYLHTTYVIGKGGKRGPETGGIAWALKTYGDDAFIARRTFREPDHYQRLLREAQEIKEKDTILNGYNRVARGGGISEHHPSTLEKMSENMKGEKNHRFGIPAANKGVRASPESIHKQLATKEAKSEGEKKEIIDKMLTTMANRTPEQKEETKRKQSAAKLGKKRPLEVVERIMETKMKNGSIEVAERKRQETISKKPQEEIDESYRKKVATMNAKQPEELAEQYRKQSETNKNKSPEEKAEINRKKQETRAKKTKEEKAETIRKSQETKNNKSPEEKEEERKRRSAAAKRDWDRRKSINIGIIKDDLF